MPELELVQKVCAYIEANIDQPVRLADLGAHVGMSPFHLQRSFKQVMGVSPRQYAEARRLDTLKAHLRGGMNVTDALYAAGYGSSSRVYERSDDQLGMTPASYGRKGAGMSIVYDICPCRVGKLLIAATERGICAVHLGESDEELESALMNEYPLAQIWRDEGRWCDWMREIVDYVNGGWQRPLNLPFDLQATSFQLRVWQALRDIPYGETKTYAQIAVEIGHPHAARAVAQAVNANPVAVLIPCHRTAREDGSPTVLYDERSKRSRSILRSEEQRETLQQS